MADRLVYLVVTIKPHPFTFCSAETLVASGLPMKVAADWKRIRRDMTTGLKRRVKENVN